MGNLAHVSGFHNQLSSIPVIMNILAESMEERKFQNNKAAARGRIAENVFSAQAVGRAANSAAVTTSTKNLMDTNQNFGRLAPFSKNFKQVVTLKVS